MIAQRKDAVDGLEIEAKKIEIRKSTLQRDRDRAQHGRDDFMVQSVENEMRAVDAQEKDLGARIDAARARLTDGPSKPRPKRQARDRAEAFSVFRDLVAGLSTHPEHYPAEMTWDALAERAVSAQQAFRRAWESR